MIDLIRWLNGDGQELSPSELQELQDSVKTAFATVAIFTNKATTSEIGALIRIARANRQYLHRDEEQ